MGNCWKSQNRKNVYRSPYVEEPLNSKVIKIFVPELRSRKCFSCFEIPMFYGYIYIYIYIYEHYMSISHIRIWLWYIKRNMMKKYVRGKCMVKPVKIDWSCLLVWLFCGTMLHAMRFRVVRKSQQNEDTEFTENH